VWHFDAIPPRGLARSGQHFAFHRERLGDAFDVRESMKRQKHAVSAISYEPRFLEGLA
jgi:hypothetical protein